MYQWRCTPAVGGTGQIPAISDPTEIFLTSYSVPNTHPHTQRAGDGLQVPAGPTQAGEHLTGIWLQGAWAVFVTPPADTPA